MSALSALVFLLYRKKERGGKREKEEKKYKSFAPQVPTVPTRSAKVQFSSIKSTTYSVGTWLTQVPTRCRHTPASADTPNTAMQPLHIKPLPHWCAKLIHYAERIATLHTEPASAADLARVLAPIPPQQIAEHLALAGWKRELVWSRAPDGRRLCRVWWSPPGTLAPRTPRGRPRQYLTLTETLALFSPEPHHE